MPLCPKKSSQKTWLLGNFRHQFVKRSNFLCLHMAGSEELARGGEYDSKLGKGGVEER